MQSVFLTARWHRLVMLNFLVDPAVLTPYTPRGTEVDDWNGSTFISLVAFRFLDTRVKGIPIPFHRNFDEVNLRFYVRHRGPEGWRRGVVFVREVVPKPAIAAVARWLYNENYVSCPMLSTVVDPADGAEGRVEYGWKHRGEWLSIAADFAGTPTLPGAGSQEEFITEHYWGYAAQRDGGAVEYQVEHPQWSVWPASQAQLDGDILGFYGPEFASALSAEPSSAFVADGSTVLVRNGRRMGDPPAL